VYVQLLQVSEEIDVLDINFKLRESFDEDGFQDFLRRNPLRFSSSFTELPFLAASIDPADLISSLFNVEPVVTTEPVAEVISPISSLPHLEENDEELNVEVEAKVKIVKEEKRELSRKELLQNEIKKLKNIIVNYKAIRGAIPKSTDAMSEVFTPEQRIENKRQRNKYSSAINRISKKLKIAEGHLKVLELEEEYQSLNIQILDAQHINDLLKEEKSNLISLGSICSQLPSLLFQTKSLTKQEQDLTSPSEPSVNDTVDKRSTRPA
jgi:hypothetical protein